MPQYNAGRLSADHLAGIRPFGWTASGFSNDSRRSVRVPATLFAPTNPAHSENFTNIDGSAPASPWITHVFSTGRADIRSNSLDLQGVVGYAGVTATYGTTAIGDLDITFSLQLNGTLQEQYPGIGYRMAGGTDGWDGTFGEVNNGYIVWLDTTTSPGLHWGRETSGAIVGGTEQILTRTLTAGQKWWIRVRVIGSTHQIGWWKDGDEFQNDWKFTISDATYSTGVWGFRNQANAATVDSFFDNVTWDDFSTGTNYNEPLSDTWINVTSDTDVATFSDILTTTGLGISSGADSIAITQALADTWVSVTSLTDLLALTEALNTIVVVPTSDTDVAAFNEILTSTGVSVTSDIDTRAMLEALTSIAIWSDSGVYLVNRGETLADTWAGVTSEIDVAAFNELVNTIGVGVTSLIDVRGFNDILTSIATGVTSDTDVAAFNDLPPDTWIVVTSEIDSTTSSTNYNEPVTTTAVTLTSLIDSLAMSEPLTTTGIVTTGLVDSRAMLEALLTTGTVLTTLSDLRALTEAVLTTGVASSSITSLLSMSEGLSTSGSGTTGDVDQQVMVDLFTTIITTVTDGTDIYFSIATPKGIFDITSRAIGQELTAGPVSIKDSVIRITRMEAG